jgi:hypothetical protein
MKRPFTAILAIILCGGLGFYWFKERQPDHALPPQVPQNDTHTGSTTLPLNLSKTDVALNEIARQPTRSPSSQPTLVQFIFDKAGPSPSSPGQHTHIIQEWKGQFSPRIQEL